MPSDWHPHPSQLIRGHYTFDACGTSLLQRAWWLLLAAAIPSPERPPSWISMLLLWLLNGSSSHGFGSVTRCMLLFCRWAYLLHVGDSRHFVMSPSEALAKLLTNDDHCCYGMVLHL